MGLRWRPQRRRSSFRPVTRPRAARSRSQNLRPGRWGRGRSGRGRDGGCRSGDRDGPDGRRWRTRGRPQILLPPPQSRAEDQNRYYPNTDQRQGYSDVGSEPWTRQARRVRSQSSSRLLDTPEGGRGRGVLVESSHSGPELFDQRVVFGPGRLDLVAHRSMTSGRCRSVARPRDTLVRTLAAEVPITFAASASPRSNWKRRRRASRCPGGRTRHSCSNQIQTSERRKAASSAVSAGSGERSSGSQPIRRLRRIRSMAIRLVIRNSHGSASPCGPRPESHDSRARRICLCRYVLGIFAMTEERQGVPEHIRPRAVVDPLELEPLGGPLLVDHQVALPPQVQGRHSDLPHQGERTTAPEYVNARQMV